MVYTVEDVRSDRGVMTVTDRAKPVQSGQDVAAGGRVEPNPARIAELLARIGALGERIDAAAQRSVEALRQANTEPGITAWDRATAESLLELAARIEAERCRLDAALERDRARLSGEDAPADEAGGAAQAAMDPIDPGMI